MHLVGKEGKGRPGAAEEQSNDAGLCLQELRLCERRRGQPAQQDYPWRPYIAWPPAEPMPRAQTLCPPALSPPLPS